jgi:hypothetical protein
MKKYFSLFLVLFFPVCSFSKTESLAEVAVIGGATGLILGAFQLLYWFVWKPIKRKRDELIKNKLIENQALSKIIVAAAEGNDDEIKRLISNGADINDCGKSGETALMMAAKNDHRLTVRVLLELGADPNAKTLKGNTAKDIARQHKNFVVSDILTEAIENSN